ncbi:hypothetical protein [Candidatus Cardinium hertigii]|uniref:Lipoprotein n=1 Tax=Candidatus Cardinium hertigii TaxID=247481 RepID=A0A3N2QB34_9BACT|nr:hypothetical protein [Candidatus Cardinium hertigii]ROT47018.1 hypothetical protein EDM02_05640 [Candidatus Cardinium hertigii]
MKNTNHLQKIGKPLLFYSALVLTGCEKKTGSLGMKDSSGAGLPSSSASQTGEKEMRTLNLQSDDIKKQHDALKEWRIRTQGDCNIAVDRFKLKVNKYTPTYKRRKIDTNQLHKFYVRNEYQDVINNTIQKIENNTAKCNEMSGLLEDIKHSLREFQNSQNQFKGILAQQKDKDEDIAFIKTWNDKFSRLLPIYIDQQIWAFQTFSKHIIDSFDKVINVSSQDNIRNFQSNIKALKEISEVTYSDIESINAVKSIIKLSKSASNVCMFILDNLFVENICDLCYKMNSSTEETDTKNTTKKFFAGLLELHDNMYSIFTRIPNTYNRVLDPWKGKFEKSVDTLNGILHDILETSILRNYSRLNEDKNKVTKLTNDIIKVLQEIKEHLETLHSGALDAYRNFYKEANEICGIIQKNYVVPEDVNNKLKDLQNKVSDYYDQNQNDISYNLDSSASEEVDIEELGNSVRP